MWPGISSHLDRDCRRGHAGRMARLSLEPEYFTRTREILRLATLIMPLSLAGSMVSDPPSTNLVANPGFELGDGGPRAWSFSWKGTRSRDPNIDLKREPDWGWDAAVAREGRRSLRIGVARREDDGVWSQDGIAHIDGTRVYCLSAWLKTEGMEGATADMGLICLDRDRKYLKADYSVIHVNENRDWARLAGLFEVAPGTKELRVRLWLNRGYSGKGKVWCDDVAIHPTNFDGPPPIRYLDSAALPALSEAQRQAGYVIFEKHPLEMVFPATVPRRDEIKERLSMFACPGEREPRVFCIRALRDLGSVRVVAGDLRAGDGVISSDRIQVNPVKCLVRRGQARWGPYMDGDMAVPVIVEDTDRAMVGKETTVAFFVTVTVPDGAMPGTYRGAVSIQPMNGEKRDLAIELAVLPIRLIEPGANFGMYTRFRREPAGFIDMAYADMRAHGMNTIGLCANLGADMKMEGDSVAVRLDGSSDIEMAIDAYRRAGFTRPLVWLMGRDVIAFSLGQGPLESDRFESAYRGVIGAIRRAATSRGWPEIIFQPVDEPYEHADKRIGGQDGPRLIDVARRCLQIMKTMPGVRTEEDGANGRPENAAALHPWVDIEVYHDGPVMRRGTYDAAAWQEFLQGLDKGGKEVWFYNTDITGFHPEAGRFGYGYGLFKSGAKGALNWSYMTAFKPEDPDGLYKHPLPMAHRYNRTDTEAGGPTTAWEGTREGVDDYRYLETLFAIIRRSKNSPAAAMAAEAEADIQKRLAAIDFHGVTGKACQGAWSGEQGILPSGEKFVSGDYKMSNGLRFEDYDGIRRAVADWIIRLQGVSR